MGYFNWRIIFWLNSKQAKRFHQSMDTKEFKFSEILNKKQRKNLSLWMVYWKLDSRVWYKDSRSQDGHWAPYYHALLLQKNWLQQWSRITSLWDDTWLHHCFLSLSQRSNKADEHATTVEERLKSWIIWSHLSADNWGTKKWSSRWKLIMSNCSVRCHILHPRLKHMVPLVT